jgi:hypothetical protein
MESKDQRFFDEQKEMIFSNLFRETLNKEPFDTALKESGFEARLDEAINRNRKGL